MAALAGGVVNRRPSRQASRRGQRLSPNRMNPPYNRSVEICREAVRRNGAGSQRLTTPARCDSKTPSGGTTEHSENAEGWRPQPFAVFPIRDHPRRFKKPKDSRSAFRGPIAGIVRGWQPRLHQYRKQQHSCPFVSILGYSSAGRCGAMSSRLPPSPAARRRPDDGSFQPCRAGAGRARRSP